MYIYGPSRTLRTLTSLMVILLFLGQMVVYAAPGGPINLDVGASTQLVMPEGGGSRTISVNIPPDGVVVDAELNLEGSLRAYPSVNIDYSFSDELAHNGWKGSLSNKPPKSLPSNLKATQATKTDEENVATSDNIYWEHTVYGPWVPNGNNATLTGVFPYEHFQFDISTAKNTLDRITVNWEGHGVRDDYPWEYCGADLYIWDGKNSEWVSLDGYGANCTLIHDTSLSGYLDLTGREGIYSSFNHVNVIVVGPWAQTSTFGAMYTDTVNLTVKCHNESVPHDVSIDVGDDGSIEKQYQGKFIDPVTFGKDQGFVDALQSIMDGTEGGQSGGDLLEVPINITSSTGGIITLEISVLDIDTPPTFISDINDIEVDEGGTLADAIDLWDYFSDDHDPQNLTYKIEWIERQDLVSLVLNDGHLLEVYTLDPDWSGDILYRVSAADRFDQIVESDNATIIIFPVNDPPVLEDIGRLTAYEGLDFKHQINSTDPDKDDHPTFGDDTALFDIEPDTGMIMFSPKTEDIGEYKVNITVTDINGSVDFEVIDLSILNVNDPPTVELYLPTDNFIVSDASIKLVWIGKDVDGDKLKYDVFVDPGTGMEKVASKVQDTDYQLTDLKDGLTYKWTVEASDDSLKSARPAPFVFRVEIDDGTGGNGNNQTLPNQPPTSALSTPAKDITIRTFTPTLTWEGFDPDGDKLTYEVLLYNSAGDLLQQEIVPDTFFRVQELQNEKRYYWTVIPFDGVDHGVCLSGQWYFTVNRTGQAQSFDPITNVSVTPEGEVDIDTQITFDASGSYDPDGTITLFIWTLGDGTTLTGPNYPSITHSFTEGGNYNVSLVVFDNEGNSGIWSHTIDVKKEEVVPSKPKDPTINGLTSGQLLIALIITALAVALGTAGAFMGYRKYRYGRYQIDEILYIFNDGRLIDHVGLKDRNGETKSKHVDKEILGSMLTAVQSFVKDSMDEGVTNDSLKVLEYGDQKIVIERGNYTVMATFITGNVTEGIREKMQEAMSEIEAKNQHIFREWDGSKDGMIDIRPNLLNILR